MPDRIKEIVAYLKTQKELLYVEGAFRLYIDNQITEEELIEILKEDGYSLPDTFKDFCIREKKSYFTHTQTRVYFENDEAKLYWYEVYNKPYFYYLAEKSRKNASLTQGTLVPYIKDIGCCSINLLFLCIQYVKLSNTKFSYESGAITLMEYAKTNKINDFYELLMSLYVEPDAKNGIIASRNNLKKYILKYFNVDFDAKGNELYEFALYVERALYVLPRKEANTIKVLFKILEPEYLREEDYYQDPDYRTRILNTFKKKINASKAADKVFKFVKNKSTVFNGFNPNGYSALYYYLLEEGK